MHFICPGISSVEADESTFEENAALKGFAPRPVKRKGSVLVHETRKAGEENDFDLKKDPLFKGDNAYHEDELYLTQESFDRLKKKTNFSKFAAVGRYA